MATYGRSQLSKTFAKVFQEMGNRRFVWFWAVATSLLGLEVVEEVVESGEFFVDGV